VKHKHQVRMKNFYLVLCLRVNRWWWILVRAMYCHIYFTSICLFCQTLPDASSIHIYHPGAWFNITVFKMH